MTCKLMSGDTALRDDNDMHWLPQCPLLDRQVDIWVQDLLVNHCP